MQTAENQSAIISSANTTGTATVSAGATALVGVGTKFLTELALGIYVYDAGGLEVGQVISVTDDLNAVISTGGGMLVHCQELKDVGKIIYLKVPFETILSRMNKSELEKRPLFKDEKKAKQMYDERDSIYEEKADFIIDANADMKTVLSRVISVLN
jgi:hypothetical protein